jgi:hypothetical protein
MYTNLVIYKVFLRYSREVLLFDLKVFVKNGGQVLPSALPAERRRGPFTV